MLTFLGLMAIAAVLFFGLRRIAKLLYAFGFTFEATVNRALAQRGEPPIVSRDEAEARFR